MDQVDYAARLAELEAQELNPEEDPSDKLYAQMLALYVLTDDLISAKFLWKRIPASVKAENQDLQTIWSVAANLIRRTPAPVFFLIQEHEWPPHVKTIISRIADRVREQQISLITSAYSDIRVADIARLTCAGQEEEAVKLAQELGWSLDPEKKSAKPRKPSRTPGSADEEREMSQEQLKKLTEYIAFLENH